MSMPLLMTKLSIPPVRAERVARQRLVQQLNNGLGRKLTLISSPAGFGKTTLLSEFVASCERPVAWLSLDEDDNDIIRFLSYLIGALRNVNPRFGESIFPVVQSPKPERTVPILTVLVNEIATDFEPFVLILDDYHVIRTEEVHEALGFVIEYQPAQMHIMIATRADPQLPLSRLRAGDQLIEVRENDLRFTGAEAAEFLNQVMGLNLDDNEVQTLERRTEGWAAGLQLAALSLKEQVDREDFIKSFAGSNRYILDYLGQEVLEQQEENTRSFLLQTSILERLSAPLCEAVSGISSSQELLEWLEQEHLFINSMDQERRWYRYHRLFADFLRNLLNQEHPDIIPTLHLKASVWFEEQGYIDEAIDQALSAGEQSRAMDLIEEIAETRLMRSEASTILRWLSALPEEAVLGRPSMCLIEALATTVVGGSLDIIESRLEVVETSDVGDDLLGSSAALRALMSSIGGDAKASLDYSTKALELLPEDNLFLRSLVADNLGMVHLLFGDYPAAIESFAEAVEISQRAGNIMITVGALCNIAGLWMFQGGLKRAWDAYQQALDIATNTRGRRLPVAGKALLGLGEIAREWGDFAAATSYLEEGLDLFKQFGELGSVISYLTLARIKEAQGEIEKAQEIADHARQLAIQFDASTMDDELVDTYQVLLWILQGKVEEAARWVEENQIKTLVMAEADKSHFNPLWELRGFTLARVYLAQGNHGEALGMTEPLLQRSKREGRLRSVMRALALRAHILLKLDRVSEALSALEDALTLGKLEGYVRVFLDEGEAMIHLLYQAASQGIEPDYVGKLLAAYGSQEPADTSFDEKTQDMVAMVEPLSAREIEVLELIEQGLTNQEIASRLHLSLSTVKGHTSSIYGKLTVHNRTQAVARARELGILPGG
jgi:LuxR family maltose regulon positive regulatory protein